MALIKPKKPADTPAPEEQRSLPRDLAGLQAALQDADPNRRRWAARDLHAFAEAPAILLTHLKQERNASVREAIMLALTEIGSSSAVNGFIQCLRSDSAALRNEAIEAMKQLPQTVAPIMRDLLADTDPDVRIFAVNVLESLRHPDVEHWLIEVITQDTHLNVCGTAVDLLGEVGTLEAVTPLEGLKARFKNEPYIQFAADLALRRIRGD
jgi:HEAT repeats